MSYTVQDVADELATLLQIPEGQVGRDHILCDAHRTVVIAVVEDALLVILRDTESETSIRGVFSGPDPASSPRQEAVSVLQAFSRLYQDTPDCGFLRRCINPYLPVETA